MADWQIWGSATIIAWAAVATAFVFVANRLPERWLYERRAILGFVFGALWIVIAAIFNAHLLTKLVPLILS